MAISREGIDYSLRRTKYGTMFEKPVHLTPTEIRVLSLISEGYSSRSVSEILTVSKRTIDFHLANVYDKLGVHNRVQALFVAGKLGLLNKEDIGPNNLRLSS